MADTPPKTDLKTDEAKEAELAEKAYADAAGSIEAKAAEPVKPTPAEPVAKKAAPAVKKAPAKKVSVKKVSASKAAAPAAQKAPAKKAAAPAVKKAATVKKTAAKPVAKKAAPIRKPAPAKITKTTPPQSSVTELKEKIMATNDFAATMTETMSDAVAEMQNKMQEAYDKGTGMVTEMTEFAKGNVEAVVESGKILAGGMQDMGKTYADEAKSAYETMTADLKEMASIKSPTELFQLQGKIMRRGFDSMVAASSKSTDAMMKLANDTVAPISGRVNVAAEKLTKVAA